MDLEQLAEHRIQRLQAFVNDQFSGSKAAAGRALGYKDGAFIGQMLRGERPITEKTVDQIQALPGGRRWFSPTKENQPDLALSVREPNGTYKVIVELKVAVKRIADHLDSVPGYDKATAISLFTTLANSPDMYEVVAAGLKSLKPEARGQPAKQA